MTGGAWQSSSTASTVAHKLTTMPDCASRPCWVQEVRVAVSSLNTVACPGRAAVYHQGQLIAVSEEISIAATGESRWVVFPFRGLGLELSTLPDGSSDVWLAFQFSERVKLRFDSVTAEDASRCATEAWPEGFHGVRTWSAETIRQWSSTPRALRAQLVVGDISVLPGTLPLLIEAPHGGRMETHWPQRQSGVVTSDRSTDLFAEGLHAELGHRCWNRAPVAVIVRVARQGADPNRAVGNATHTTQGELCVDHSNGQCCCDIADPADQEVAMRLVEAYHASVVRERQLVGSQGLQLSVHGLARDRLEVGWRLSGDRLNAAAARDPPHFTESDFNRFSSRALGHDEELVWGSTGLGARLDETLDVEVIPSSTVRCPGCAGSSSEDYFYGGYGMDLTVSDTQAAVQIEMPYSMRGGNDGKPRISAVRGVAAALAHFLNDHVLQNETCHTDVNFGVECGARGQAHQGACLCDTGYSGDTCLDCAPNYVPQADGTCQSVGYVGSGIEAEGAEKHAWAYSESYGKHYVYWRRAPLLLEGCVTCPALEARLKVHCDQSSCHADVPDGSYTAGVALYGGSGEFLCDDRLEVEPGSSDRWLHVPVTCPSLASLSTNHIYIAMWFTKKIRVRWEIPSMEEARAHACKYDASLLETEPGEQSADGCVDVVPPSQLPAWRDDACETLSSYMCKSWTTSGVRNYYAPRLYVVYVKQ